MTLSDADIKELILFEIGDVYPATGDVADPITGLPPGPSGLVAQLMDTLWAKHANKRRVPGLQELYVRRDGLSMLIGRLADRVDQQIFNLDTSDGQDPRNRRSQLDFVVKQIENLEAEARANRAPAAATYTQASVARTRPSQGGCGPDASNPRYGGWPYR